jgi:hypothetical protein
MTVTINATKARQNFFDLLIATRDKKQETKIKLDGVVVGKIVPVSKKKEKPKMDFVELVKSFRKSKLMTMGEMDRLYWVAMMKKHGKYLP